MREEIIEQNNDLKLELAEKKGTPVDTGTPNQRHMRTKSTVSGPTYPTQ